MTLSWHRTSPIRSFQQQKLSLVFHLSLFDLPHRQAGSPFNPSPYQGEGNRERLITLKVYDILGKEVATLVNEEKPAGNYEIEFSAGQESFPVLPSGVYFYQLNSHPSTGSGRQFVETKKMLLLK